MADRVMIKRSPPQIVISKPGYSASSPSLADANKVFDSNWFFGGSIIHAGVHEFSYSNSWGALVSTIPFPARTYTPAAILYQAIPPGNRIPVTGEITTGLHIGGPWDPGPPPELPSDYYPPRIYPNRIEIFASRGNNSRYQKVEGGPYFQSVLAVVFAV